MDAKVHPQDRMTSRERLLAAYAGQEVDRLPYWAKIANPTWRNSQPQDVRGWSNLELLDYIHADGIFHCPSVMRVTRPHIKTEDKTANNMRVTVTHTPDGDLTETWRMDSLTQSWHPVEFPVKTIEHVKRWRWWCKDLRLEPDEEGITKGRALCKERGQRGVFLTGWGTSPLMNLVQHVMGLAGTNFLLADHPSEMEELIDLMHRDNLARAAFVARNTPADIVISVENTSTTLISPQQFEKYCYKHLCDYGRAIESAGKMHELHMCGHTRALLPRINAIPAASIEAYTSPTLGNTRLADGRASAPGKTLVGGTNVNVWLWPVERIKEYIVTEVAACVDNRRTVLTTAGVAPPGCPAERFRDIGEWIHTVPIRM
jgi:uroporphyrinogen-III decarboxylase